MSEPQRPRKRKRRPGGAAAPAPAARPLPSEPPAPAVEPSSGSQVSLGDRAKSLFSSEPPPAQDIPPADTAAERRLGRVAGAAALLALVLEIAVLRVGAPESLKEGRIPRGHSPSARTVLSDIYHGANDQLIALGLLTLALALMAVFVVYIYRVIKARNPNHPSWIPVLGAVSFLVVVLTTLVGFLETHHAASQFYASGPRTTARAKDILDDARNGPGLRISSTIQVVAGFASGLWVSLTSYEGMQTGVLTRFLSVFGLGAGITTATGLPIGAAMFAGWIGSLAVLALGWWPGGRPPAWEEGRAVPWSEVDEREGRRRYASRG